MRRYKVILDAEKCNTVILTKKQSITHWIYLKKNIRNVYCLTVKARYLLNTGEINDSD